MLVGVYFNPRPREEGDGSYRDNVGAPINFNPRPREEGDRIFGDVFLQPRLISIHALVKRATGLRGAFFINGDISIHALVKRATMLGLVEGTGWNISIHALVKRATRDLPH